MSWARKLSSSYHNRPGKSSRAGHNVVDLSEEKILPDASIDSRATSFLGVYL